MAIAWWMDTGVHFKMASDVKAEYGSHSNYWQRPKIRDNLPLDFSHVVTSIIIFGVATFISIIVFALEIVHYLSRQNKIKKNRRKKQWQLKRAKPQLNRSSMNQPKIPMKVWAWIHTDISM